VPSVEPAATNLPEGWKDTDITLDLKPNDKNTFISFSCPPFSFLIKIAKHDFFSASANGKSVSGNAPSYIKYAPILFL